MAEQRKSMDKQKFAEAERLLAEVEKAANDLAKAPPAEKDKAMMAMNKLTDSLKERQKQLGSPEQVNRQLQQLKDMASDGPARRLRQGPGQGGLREGRRELKQIKEKLASGKMTEKEKEQLKQQVGQMAKELEKLANLDQRKKQLEEAKKNGGLSQEQFDKEMAKLNDQAKGLENLKKMAASSARPPRRWPRATPRRPPRPWGCPSSSSTRWPRRSPRCSRSKAPWPTSRTPRTG